MTRQSAETPTNAFQVLMRSTSRMPALVPMAPWFPSGIPSCSCASCWCTMERQRRPSAI
jgi:hypothetical protein